MSYYEDERPRRHRGTKERSRRDDYDDSVYDSRDTRDNRQTSLVQRRDDSVSSVEEITRDFPPGERGGAYYRETTVRKSGHRPVTRARSFGDDRYDDRYDDRSYVSRKRRDDDTYVAKRSSKNYESKRDRRSAHYDSYSDDSSRSRGTSRKDRRKSTAEELLASVGLGGLAAQVLGKHRSRSRSRDRARSHSRLGRRSRSDSSDRSRGKNRDGVRRDQVAQALKAAVLAGAGEAFRARKEPGGWGGDKGKRVLTAAISAGGVDGLISNHRDPDRHGTRDVIGSAIAGLATNRIVNGPRSRSRGRGGSPNGRGRSQSRGGLGDLAAGGVVAATAKKVYDSVRSRSRGRAASRDSSYDSYDSRSPPRRKRSQSVSAGLAKGLAAIGLKDAADKVDPDRGGSRRHDDYYDDRSSRNGGYGYRDSRDVGSQPRSGPAPVDGVRAVSASRAPPGSYSLDYGPHHTGDPETDSDSDLGSSSGEEKERNKSRKKQMLGAGLATVATIHAAHNVYESMEKRNLRKKAVKEGEITKEQAQREKNKNRLQDAASIGIAALGIKGAYSEWKEMKETREEHEAEKAKWERHKAKREARRRKMNSMGGQTYVESGYSASLPNLVTGGAPYYPPNGPYSAVNPAQPRYVDDNPYSAMGSMPEHYIPPPPMGPPRSDIR